MSRTMTDGVFLGVDGGGTKTEFVLIDAAGRMRARHRAAGAYHLQIGIDGVARVLAEGVTAVLAQAGIAAAEILYAFFGLPAHGEDSQTDPKLDGLPETILGHHRYRVGNDMVCGWAGSLAGEDGINIVAGTGSIGYGERNGLAARSGGWGEVFGDEGSAYWIAVQGLNAFSRMSDGRMVAGPLHEMFRTHFALSADLDLCGRVMGEGAPSRDSIAALSKLVAQAATAGDVSAMRIFDRAGFELAAIADAIRVRLGYERQDIVRVSYSGGVFRGGETILQPLQRHLKALFSHYLLCAPLLPPSIGAAVYSARLGGLPLDRQALAGLPAE
jgi:N-acetylglucosamine kinase-like BadF-type ATPase